MFTVVGCSFRRVEKWNIKFKPSPPISTLRTAASSGPFKIVKLSKTSVLNVPSFPHSHPIVITMFWRFDFLSGRSGQPWPPPLIIFSSDQHKSHGGPKWAEGRLSLPVRAQLQNIKNPQKISGQKNWKKPWYPCLFSNFEPKTFC